MSAVVMTYGPVVLATTLIIFEAEFASDSAFVRSVLVISGAEVSSRSVVVGTALDISGAEAASDSVVVGTALAISGTEVATDSVVVGTALVTSEAEIATDSEGVGVTRMVRMSSAEVASACTVAWDVLIAPVFTSVVTEYRGNKKKRANHPPR